MRIRTPKKAIIFCGSRYWRNKSAIEYAFEKFQPRLVISGGQRGADTLSIEVAQDTLTRFKIFEADWNQYGRAAGPFRNEEMLKYLLSLKEKGWEISVVGFPHRDGRGTQNMIFQALLQNVPSYTYKTTLKFKERGKGARTLLSTRFD